MHDAIAEFVSDGEIPEPIDAHVPARDEFVFTSRDFGNEGFLDEGFALRVIGECRAVWIESPGSHNGFPVFGANEDPSPVPELRHRILCERLAQNGHVRAAFFQSVAGVADKA